VIESAVKFDVMEDGSLILSKPVEGRNLLNHDVLEFGWGWSDGRAAEGGWVGPAGMSPDAHLSLLGEADGEVHGVGGSSVTATGYVCDRDMLEQLESAVGGFAFTEIAIDGINHWREGFSRRVNWIWVEGRH